MPNKNKFQLRHWLFIISILTIGIMLFFWYQFYSKFPSIPWYKLIIWEILMISIFLWLYYILKDQKRQLAIIDTPYEKKFIKNDYLISDIVNMIILVFILSSWYWFYFNYPSINLYLFLLIELWLLAILITFNYFDGKITKRKKYAFYHPHYFDQHIEDNWYGEQPSPDRIRVVKITKKWEDIIDINFYSQWGKCMPWEPDAETWEVPNTMYRVRWKWKLTCEWVIKYTNPSNIKSFTKSEFKISENIDNLRRTITLSLPWKNNIKIIANKVFLTERDRNTSYSKEKNKFVLFKKRF